MALLLWLLTPESQPTFGGQGNAFIEHKTQNYPQENCQGPKVHHS